MFVGYLKSLVDLPNTLPRNKKKGFQRPPDSLQVPFKSPSSETIVSNFAYFINK